MLGYMESDAMNSAGGLLSLHSLAGSCQHVATGSGSPPSARVQQKVNSFPGRSLWLLEVNHTHQWAEIHRGNISP